MITFKHTKNKNKITKHILKCICVLILTLCPFRMKLRTNPRIGRTALLTAMVTWTKSGYTYRILPLIDLLHCIWLTLSWRVC